MVSERHFRIVFSRLKIGKRDLFVFLVLCKTILNLNDATLLP